MKRILVVVFLFIACHSNGQVKWENVDSLFGPLPASVHVYKTTSELDGKPNIAYYVEAGLKNKALKFDVDTTLGRRLKPSEYYERNKQPVVVVNTTFFSFASNQNLNAVIKKEKLVGYNIHSIAGRGKDTLTYRHPFGSAIGISKKGNADIAWLFTDSSRKSAYALQTEQAPVKDSIPFFTYEMARQHSSVVFDGGSLPTLNKWKMKTAVGGGPVLVQYGQVRITNDEELKFAGKAIDDKHPRTAMGYTKDNKLIILVIEGRNPDVAEGASLTQTAKMLKDIGCWEALNLDGGGSSCMLVNGKETIKVSDATGQRPVPAVFIIKAAK